MKAWFFSGKGMDSFAALDIDAACRYLEDQYGGELHDMTFHESLGGAKLITIEWNVDEDTTYEFDGELLEIEE